MSETQAPKAPLDEVMLAMDVVDTLRHRELIVQRELSADDRDRQLIARLRDIYAGQGIEVTEAVLERGVRDLREDRFSYTPPAPSFARTLAHIYVSRGRWAPPLGFVTALVAVAVVAYQLLVVGPQAAAIAALPQALERSHAAVVSLAEEPEVDARADTLRAAGQQALSGEDFAGAREAIADLDSLYARLNQQFEMHVVSRPGQLSGVWRIPQDNPNAQNFYLIVEAIDADGERVRQSIVSEETGRTAQVLQWGQRVEESKFRAVAGDKQDDGIIQDDVIGTKRRGVLENELQAGVLTGAITDW